MNNKHIFEEFLDIGVQRKLNDVSKKRYIDSLEHISKVLEDESFIDRNIFLINDVKIIEKVYDYLLHGKGKGPLLNSTGHQMYSATVGHYLEMLKSSFKPTLSGQIMRKLGEKEEEEIEKFLEDPMEQSKIVSPNYSKRLVLDRESIISSKKVLENLYHNKCQICGENVGLQYSTSLNELHHLDYYSESFDNSLDNLILVCPNHHRLIHKLGLRFDRSLKTLVDPKRYFSIALKLNKHI